MNKKLAHSLWIIFGIVIFSVFATSLVSEDVDTLCDTDNTLLYRYNGVWGCGRLDPTKFNITNNIVTNVTNITIIQNGNITGSGTAGNLSYWINDTSLGASNIYYNGTNIGINQISPDRELVVSQSSGTSSTIVAFNDVGSSNNAAMLLQAATNIGILNSQKGPQDSNKRVLSFRSGGTESYRIDTQSQPNILTTDKWIINTTNGFMTIGGNSSWTPNGLSITGGQNIVLGHSATSVGENYGSIGWRATSSMGAISSGGKISYNITNSPTSGDAEINIYATYNGTAVQQMSIGRNGGVATQGNLTVSNGFVGIGRTTPLYPLTVTGSGNTITASFERTDNYPTIRLYRNQSLSAGDIGRYSFYTNPNGGSANTEMARITALTDGASTRSSINFQTYLNSGLNTVMTINSSGSVGIGTTAPASNLEVQGATSTSIRVTSPAASDSKVQIANNAVRWEIMTPGSTNRLEFRDDGGRTMATLTSNGGLGIATTAPTQALDVRGNFNVSQAINMNNFAYGACNSALEGAVVYNSTARKHFGCNSTAWNALY